MQSTISTDQPPDFPPLHPQLIQELRAAVADLQDADPWAGLVRFISLGGLTLGMTILTWKTDHISLFILGAIATSLVYAFWLICNHDATHRRLTGWEWFDILMPRLISWPMLWPVGTYNQLHRLHHGWNGIDLRDPERVQWTTVEYLAAPAWQRWYIRHQWPIDILIFGGIGLIVRTFSQGIKQQNNAPHLRQQMLIDVVGIIGTQAAIFGIVALQMLSVWQYLLFWIVLERGIGIIVQTRDHLEHYGLWQQTTSYQITQLYACRNLTTPQWVNWLMGGLPYHSVHHAFPKIAYRRLPEAFQRIQAVLFRHQLPPLPTSLGYIATSLHLSGQTSLILASLTPHAIASLDTTNLNASNLDATN
ncbi:MAG: fatty acid desaturase [Phormidesmis sp. RL_2_1]|nr:fatty acid desaturase [Phormidesmis sp. RL_2_1]